MIQEELTFGGGGKRWNCAVGSSILGLFRNYIQCYLYVTRKMSSSGIKKPNLASIPFELSIT